ncbi:hypothetical protein ACFSOZ_30710 [Mesorhizobium newzealandense]|uniref:Uncharacterized protein n=1 Tax=Mesorhizobium newzealandense TaxID=1300302 RepID=A0ABW4UH29_9HYPH
MKKLMIALIALTWVNSAKADGDTDDFAIMELVDALSPNVHYVIIEDDFASRAACERKLSKMKKKGRELRCMEEYMISVPLD